MTSEPNLFDTTTSTYRPALQSHDRAFAICKALAIICVVLSHAGGPTWLNHFVFQFHVPVFFIVAGYFFKERHADNWGEFVGKKFSRLYMPFLRWSLFFLLVHNLWFYTGILNEEFGNAAGGVLHPYNWHTFSQRAWSIVFNMSGYDEFLAGSFWFFRALFVSSLLFLLAYKLTQRICRALEKPSTPITVGLSILVLMALLGLWQSVESLTMTGVAQRGFREIQACTLMAFGYVFGQYEYQNASVAKPRFRLNGWVALAALAYLVVSTIYFPTSMGYSATLKQWATLPLAGMAGFLLLLWFSRIVAAKGAKWLSNGLVYIGDRTLYVFAFHLLAFKLVSALKVWWLGLPWNMVGCHTVIHQGAQTDAFFLLYLVVGVALPLLWLAAYRKLTSTYDLRINWAKIFNRTVGNRALQILVGVLVFIVGAVWKVLSTIVVGTWKGIKSFFFALKKLFVTINTNDED